MVWDDILFWKSPSGERWEMRAPPVETKGAQPSWLWLSQITGWKPVPPSEIYAKWAISHTKGRRLNTSPSQLQ
jgi:hypothetical protein